MLNGVTPTHVFMSNVKPPMYPSHLLIVLIVSIVNFVEKKNKYEICIYAKRIIFLGSSIGIHAAWIFEHDICYFAISRIFVIIIFSFLIRLIFNVFIFSKFMRFLPTNGSKKWWNTLQGGAQGHVPLLSRDFRKF